MALVSSDAMLGRWLLLLAAGSVVRGGSYAGPYLLNIKSVKNCPLEEVGDQIIPLDLRLYVMMKHNRTTSRPIVAVENATISNDLFSRGATKLSLDVARWDTVSGWRDHFLIMAIGDLCFVLEDMLGNDYRQLVADTDAPTKCPARNGEYTGGNLPARMPTLRQFPALPYGRYRVYTLFLFARPTKGPKVRACLRVIVDVIPRI